MRNIRILKLVHQNMFVTFLQLLAPPRIILQQLHGFRDQPVQRYRILLLQNLFARQISPRNFLLQRHVFAAFLQRVLVQRRFFFFQFLPQLLRKRLVILAGHQFILAARKKCYEIAQKLSRLRQSAEFFQLQPRQIPPQQYPMVHLFQRRPLLVHFF